MPIYEYNCTKCSKHFEATQKITEPPTCKCPSCGAMAKRIISQSTFSLKGGGWYKDGYGSSGSVGKKETGSKPKVKSEK